jgi:hypothetical protein
MKNRTPSYCLHKATGQAVVRIDGKDHYYLGKYGTKDSRDAYDRLIAEWLAAGRRRLRGVTAGGHTVNEVLLAYWRWAEKNYCDSEGMPTRELNNLKDALRPLRTRAAAPGIRAWPRRVGWKWNCPFIGLLEGSFVAIAGPYAWINGLMEDRFCPCIPARIAFSGRTPGSRAGGCNSMSGG